MFTALDRFSKLVQHFSDSVDVSGTSMATSGTLPVEGKAKEQIDWPDVVYTKNNTVSNSILHTQGSHAITKHCHRH